MHEFKQQLSNNKGLIPRKPIHWHILVESDNDSHSAWQTKAYDLGVCVREWNEAPHLSTVKFPRSVHHSRQQHSWNITSTNQHPQRTIRKLSFDRHQPPRSPVGPCSWRLSWNRATVTVASRFVLRNCVSLRVWVWVLVCVWVRVY